MDFAELFDCSCFIDKRTCFRTCCEWLGELFNYRSTFGGKVAMYRFVSFHFKFYVKFDSHTTLLNLKTNKKILLNRIKISKSKDVRRKNFHSNQQGIIRNCNQR